MIMQGASLTVSKEIVRLRLYALCLAGDMAGLFIAFLLANWLVVGAFLGEPGKPHGLVMFSMVAPLYAILAVQGGAYGINTLDRVRRGIFRALLALAQAALLMLLIVYLGKIAEQLSRLTFLTGPAPHRRHHGRGRDRDRRPYGGDPGGRRQSPSRTP